MSRFIYLHGFASGPTSNKARFFRERFAELGMGLDVPDLTEGRFEQLTISGQLAVIERIAKAGAVSLIGSSMGGYLAALYAARHPEVEKLILLAPAFSLLTRWPDGLGEEKMEEWKRTRSMQVFDYVEKRNVPIGYQLIEDAQKYEAYPDVAQPVLIFHGKQDTTVLPGVSVEFAKQHPQTILHLVESDHQLLNVLGDIWMESEKFLFR
ncbi:MAG TPA: YqiA/YcfP family alpha/beta fold hydrolase [Bryobacteraceae bacterium]|nr:YqiA/YcfP family alpha/beta fold hydrolase [Bryobacteraceae bacterium]